MTPNETPFDAKSIADVKLQSKFGVIKIWFKVPKIQNPGRR